jgi:hypothetical protein
MRPGSHLQESSPNQEHHSLTVMNKIKFVAAKINALAAPLSH